MPQTLHLDQVRALFCGVRVFELRTGLTDRVVEMLEEERKRLAREIHDGPAQSLTNVAMRLEVVKRLAVSDRVPEAVQEVERLQLFLRGAINDARRMIFDLRPTFLENGVEDAIRLYARRFTQTFGIPVTVDGQWGPVRLPHTVEVTLFRVYQEALQNVYKHAGATSVMVQLDDGGRCKRLVIQDDGCGFDVSERDGSFGLQGMRERMALIGGTIGIVSSPGEGTIVQCEVDSYHA